MKCRTCNIELTDDNWHISLRKNGRYECKLCCNLRVLKHIKRNPEKRKQVLVNYRLSHRKYRKDWLQTVEGRIYSRRYCTVRRNGFGFNPLNTYFYGCHSHHINNIDVIYIPKEIHKEFCGKHTQKKPITLLSINAIALFFLMQQNIEEIRKIFKE